MCGLVHIYCGDGKGKTTAAVGLAIRAAGAGKKVIFAQFFKNGSSSEIKVLKGIENIKLCLCNKNHGFYFNMDEAQRQEACCDYANLFMKTSEHALSADLLVLDEIISACNFHMVKEYNLIEFIKNKPDGLEVVLTGRDPSQKLIDIADYITQMQKVKHPFDLGIKARRGIEF